MYQIYIYVSNIYIHTYIYIYQEKNSGDKNTLSMQRLQPKDKLDKYQNLKQKNNNTHTKKKRTLMTISKMIKNGKYV